MPRIHSSSQWWDHDGIESDVIERLYEVEITRREFRLLMRIRQLHDGKYTLKLEKNKQGMRGLVYFEVT